MSKTIPEDLVKPVALEMANYLKNGEINTAFVESKLEYKGIERFQDLESIMKIHFVLSKEVVSFLEKLPRRVRRIRTESKQDEVTRRGEVRGRINWGKTLIQQNTSNDPSLFVCNNPSRNYNVSENLVLKKLLYEIYTVLETDLKTPLEKDYNWLKGLRGEQDLINHLKNIYRKNVHISRIMHPEEYMVTERDISICENSRKELYKEAGELMYKFNKLMNGDYEEEDIRELLKETLILPGDAATMFELYSVFSLLKRFRKDFRLRKIEAGSKEIAIFENEDTRIKVYHDSQGSKILRFFEGMDQLKDVESDIDYLERYRRSIVKYAEINEFLTGGEKSSVYSGRPDILIEHYEDDRLVKLEIGEVKYTGSQQTFFKGLKELIEYIYFVKEKNEYILEKDKLEGILIVDKMEHLDRERLDEDGAVHVGDFCKLTIYDTEALMELYDG